MTNSRLPTNNEKLTTNSDLVRLFQCIMWIYSSFLNDLGNRLYDNEISLTHIEKIARRYLSIISLGSDGKTVQTCHIVTQYT